MRRLGIGRSYYNKLFRFYTNEDLPEGLRIEFFAAAVIGGASYGSEAWAYSDKLRSRIKGWAARMLSCITGRSVEDESRDPTLIAFTNVHAWKLRARVQTQSSREPTPSTPQRKAFPPSATRKRNQMLAREPRDLHSRASEFPESTFSL